MTKTKEKYFQCVKTLSDRIVVAQKPIRILDSIKWGPHIQQEFFKSRFKKQPLVTADEYAPLSFDPLKKMAEFDSIIDDIRHEMGLYNPLGRMMIRICTEYMDVVHLLLKRGHPEFPYLSYKLYGKSSDALYVGSKSLMDMAKLILDTTKNLEKVPFPLNQEKTIPSQEAVALLQERLTPYFQGAEVRVILSDGIVSDASAGADYIKIRRDALFSMQDIRLLEIHEGWVHLGTTLNGMRQPYCTFLSKGAPSSTTTQEGLAILMEIFCFASNPNRVRHITNRIKAVYMAEKGATFLDVFQFYRQESYADSDAYNQTVRIFRGSTPEGGPFTKDLVYSKGFILIYNYIRLAVRRGKIHYIPLLFSGKTTLEDVKVLYELKEEGLITAPQYLPPQFQDLAALCAWMGYSNFLNQLRLKRIEADYTSIL